MSQPPKIWNCVFDGLRLAGVSFDRRKGNGPRQARRLDKRPEKNDKEKTHMDKKPRKTGSDSALAQLRSERGMTQRELAARVGCHPKDISRWETGTVLPGTALSILPRLVYTKGVVRK